MRDRIKLGDNLIQGYKAVGGAYESVYGTLTSSKTTFSTTMPADCFVNVQVFIMGGQDNGNNRNIRLDINGSYGGSLVSYATANQWCTLCFPLKSGDVLKLTANYIGTYTWYYEIHRFWYKGD